MAEFKMPSLGADMEEGTLVEWLIQPGERVKRGDIVAAVETQKGLFEIESFEDGILGEPQVSPGQTVPVGTVLAMIQADGAPSPSEESPPPASEQQGTEPSATTQAPVVAAIPVPAPSQRIAASPAARRRAAELGLDLAGIQGSGPDGAIQLSDVEQAARPASGEAPPHAVLTPSSASREGMRQAIAAAMSRANREIPHYYLETDIDLSRALLWLEEENRKRPIRERILPAALLLKAVAKALAAVPELNGYWLDNRLQASVAIHIGFAISLRDGGLITPAIHNVDQLNLSELMKAMADLIERTRANRLRGSEMTDATVTVTNLGDLGVKTVFGVIYPPQVALVGFGRITERPWAENGMLGVRRCVTATLAADHRASDGHRGGQFLAALDRFLQTPDDL
ncbi:dihydrolipoamide acetyltransferase family protein [Trichloromonas sp.]|uniref:dihydrolipoamide acetyltransferase family protein n=1 Tax=Trichloromonas sp. TaxID=3069249 RepID=UPI002A41E047|nr:dihydrolipoamide acetyltransferase family protein [Trichloromonas sp.]